MSTKFTKVFGSRRNIIIGALHLPPLLGYPDFPGFDLAIRNALHDLEAFASGGADAVIFENNYDIPHKTTVDSSVVAALTHIGESIKAASRIPVGISVLWNDYRTALSLAKILGLDFIRVPVFVDRVRTDYGIVEPAATECMAFRSSIQADDVALLTDIHVKHSTLLSSHSLQESADLARRGGSDALIVTGHWTGDAPDLKSLEDLRTHVEDFPILVGSGLDASNASSLMRLADGAIVSTSLKQGQTKAEEVNVKPYDARIGAELVKALMASLGR